jgi:Flp pilus assembly protein TadG
VTERTLGRDCRGVVMLEFLVAFVPVLVLFLGVLQLALLAVAQLAVQHAAIAGARSASVVLDDDPAAYGGEARGEASGARMDTIRRAVTAPLAVLPGYEPGGTTLSLATEGGELAGTGVLEAADTVTAQVEQLVPCLVPIARLLTCPLHPQRDSAAGMRARRLGGRATMPRFSARYPYPSERQAGGS